MVRLVLLLCSVMFVVMLVGGREQGQMRPGLAAALDTGPAPVSTPPSKVAFLDAPPLTTLARPLVTAAPVAAAVPAELAAIDEAETPAPVETVREPAFTLAGFAEGTEVVPGSASDANLADPDLADASPDGQVWYVTAQSVNVRSGPSTEFAVLDRLARGDAALVVAAEGDTWVRIRVEGDGVEGYVSRRYLAQTAP